MKRFGLLGGRLKHSLSPQIHKYLKGYDYSLFELPEGEVASFIKNADFDAINVTIPYKKTVMPYLDRIDDFAKKIGSVNTVKKEKDGSLSGYNTDYYGFSYLLDRSGIEVLGKKAMILGSGGSAVTVEKVLCDKGASSITVISRSGEDNYSNIHKHFDAEIIVNTTPVGMYPENYQSPIELESFSKCSAVVDIIYNPLKTKLLLDAEKLGIKYSNGLSMLVAQAKRAAEIFLDERIDDGEIERVLSLMERDAKNVILIGMPGSGKSTVADFLGKMLSRKVVDTDSLIGERAGKSIPQIFEDDGEDVFRCLESDVCFSVCRELSQVIATGGGIIKRAENLPLLKQNGFVVFLDRDISELSTDGRPLSVDADALKRMYADRYPIYKAVSDVTVRVDDTPDAIAKKIISLFEAAR